MRIFSRFGRFAVLGIQMLNLVPKPLIQVQFLVGTPLQKPRFHWGFLPKTAPDEGTVDGFFLQKSSNRSQTEARTRVR